MKVLLLTAVVITLALVHGKEEVALDQGEEEASTNGNDMAWWLGEPRPMLQPCQKERSTSAFELFVSRHVINGTFNRSSEDAWRRYLRRTGLCGRAPVQTFIELRSLGSVLQICSRSGRRLLHPGRNKGNLCMSQSGILKYKVQSYRRGRSCIVVRGGVRRVTENLVVACDRIGPNCLPTHLERYVHQRPSNIPCRDRS